MVKEGILNVDGKVWGAYRDTEVDMKLDMLYGASKVLHIETLKDKKLF